MSQCVAVTRDPTGWGHRYPCTYRAKMHHEGKSYCGVHDPVKKAAREAKRKAEWDAKYDAIGVRQHKLDAHDALVKALEWALPLAGLYPLPTFSQEKRDAFAQHLQEAETTLKEAKP